MRRIAPPPGRGRGCSSWIEVDPERTPAERAGMNAISLPALDPPPPHNWLRHLISGRCPRRGDDDDRSDERRRGRWPGWADVAATQARCGLAAAAGRGPGDGLALAGGHRGDAERLARR